MPTIVGYHDITKGQDHWLRSPKRKVCERRRESPGFLPASGHAELAPRAKVTRA